MTPIVGILLCGLPLLLGDLIARIVDTEPDLAIVGTVSDENVLSATLDQTGARVLVVGMTGADLPSAVGDLLFDYPGLRLVGISAEGHRGFLYELRPHAVALGEISPQLLVSIARDSQAHC